MQPAVRTRSGPGLSHAHTSGRSDPSTRPRPTKGTDCGLLHLLRTPSRRTMRCRPKVGSRTFLENAVLNHAWVKTRRVRAGEGHRSPHTHGRFGLLCGANSATRREAPCAPPWAVWDDPRLSRYLHGALRTLTVQDNDKRGPQSPRFILTDFLDSDFARSNHLIRGPPPPLFRHLTVQIAPWRYPESLGSSQTAQGGAHGASRRVRLS